MRPLAVSCFCFLLIFLLTERGTAQWTVDFEDLNLASESAVVGDASQAPFESRLTSFNRTYLDTYDCCPGAWAYSNQTDLLTAGFLNPYSAYAMPGGGVNGSANFGVANNTFLGDAVITLPASTMVNGFYVTNTTYAYLAVANGNDGQEPGQPPIFVKGPFEADDWFLLQVVGRDESGTETGRVPFYLADFRSGATTVIDNWTWVDLSDLGTNVNSLAFEMSSTDTGMFGMNTPAYFAIDDLTLTTLIGDFNTDFAYSCDDVDALVVEIASGANDPDFDITGDGFVNDSDLNQWLATAGAANLPSGNSFLPGDANLDGAVDGIDFLLWNENKFEAAAAWCRGDFDGSGVVDGSDFLLWNDNKFQSASATTVPEPATKLIECLLILLIASLDRRSS